MRMMKMSLILKAVLVIGIFMMQTHCYARVRRVTTMERFHTRRQRALYGGGGGESMQECKCQHCPCLYGGDEGNCRICFVCDADQKNGAEEQTNGNKQEDVSREIVGQSTSGADESEEGSGAAGIAPPPQSAMPQGVNRLDLSRIPAASPDSSTFNTYSQNNMGATCCSSDPCCYYQF